MGGFTLALSVMLFLACRDPERNVAVINGMSVGLCILAVTPLISLYTLDVQRFYPGYLIGHALWCGWRWRVPFITYGRGRHTGTPLGISE